MAELGEVDDAADVEEDAEHGHPEHDHTLEHELGHAARHPGPPLLLLLLTRGLQTEIADIMM